MSPQKYKAMVSSDWNECLAPCGPFDAVIFHHPEQAPMLDTIFRQYTGNIISLQAAVQQIEALLPHGISLGQMDAYLDAAFETYRGVPELMAWCRSRDILFMINTTGMIGYFQRALAGNLLPAPAALSAHPWVMFPMEDDGPQVLQLHDTTDKGRHTALIAEKYAIAPKSIIIMGDSGGDGPHFFWGASVGARLIGSMTKPSLRRYCRDNGISLQVEFGHTYQEGEAKNPQKEKQYNFLDLSKIIEKVL